MLAFKSFGGLTNHKEVERWLTTLATELVRGQIRMMVVTVFMDDGSLSSSGHCDIIIIIIISSSSSSSIIVVVVIVVVEVEVEVEVVMTAAVLSKEDVDLQFGVLHYIYHHFTSTTWLCATTTTTPPPPAIIIK